MFWISLLFVCLLNVQISYQQRVLTNKEYIPPGSVHVITTGTTCSSISVYTNLELGMLNGVYALPCGQLGIEIPNKTYSEFTDKVIKDVKYDPITSCVGGPGIAIYNCTIGPTPLLNEFSPACLVLDNRSTTLQAVVSLNYTCSNMTSTAMSQEHVLARNTAPTTLGPIGMSQALASILFTSILLAISDLTTASLY
ncbi:hypothetical protein BDF19DRAFT_420261 [Syncephalis fuscata]|nr:hypothetical protein BDF19DRAFT_420261 [Syncephalis fuscata]